MVEIPGFFSLYCDVDGSVLFKGWYFEDSKELLSLNLNISGLFCFAFSDNKANTQPMSRLKYLQMYHSENVSTFLRVVDVPQEANIILVRQEDAEERCIALYNKIVNVKKDGKAFK